MSLLNIVDFGATAGGPECTAAVQKAVDACAAEGGGTVVVPAGVFMMGGVCLRSNICLMLTPGAVIRGTLDESLYPLLPKPEGAVYRNGAIISAVDVEDVAIEGLGCVEGLGSADLTIGESHETLFRPKNIFFQNCRRVRISNIALRRSSFWTCHFLKCEDVAVRGVSIDNNLRRVNTDGLNIDGCRDVRVSDCSMRVGDDCVVLKSSRGEPCENIVVCNCVMTTVHGGINVGKDALGPVRNVLVQNCVIDNTSKAIDSHMAVGIAVHMKDGGLYENINFSNIVVQSNNEVAILVDNVPRFHGETQPGCVRNIVFSNVTVLGKGRMLLKGHKASPIRNIGVYGLVWTVNGYGISNRYRNGTSKAMHNPKDVNALEEPYHIIVVDAEGVTLDVKLSEDRTGGSPDRGFLYLKNVTDSTFDFVTAKMDTGDLNRMHIGVCGAIQVKGI